LNIVGCMHPNCHRKLQGNDDSELHLLMRDVLIVGGGIAGLTAATYLGRFRRPALVIDAGSSRARWIPRSHNIPGFAGGVGGEELLDRLRTQATTYGAEFLQRRVDSLHRRDSAFELIVGSESIRSRFVILATGVKDHLPELPRVAEAVLRSVLRICPICDGFEAIDKRIAVVGDGERGQHEAEFLRTYSDQVAYLHVGGRLNGDSGRRLADQGIEVIETGWDRLVIKDNRLAVALSHDGHRSYDVFYSALGCAPQIQLASALGAECDENHALRVNAHQQTSVDGLYAAGDNVRGLNQVVVAAAEAALAATDIHNRLRASRARFILQS
jgi:thioredoxin reductase (NADPH)